MIKDGAGAEGVPPAPEVGGGEEMKVRKTIIIDITETDIDESQDFADGVYNDMTRKDFDCVGWNWKDNSLYFEFRKEIEL